MNKSIFAPPNKYGYKIAINHPKIRPLYDTYKKKLGTPVLSDDERLRFEWAVMKMIEGKKGNIHE